MTGKTYTDSGGTPTAYSTTSGFGQKVDNARKKVDSNLGGTSVVQNAGQLKTALNTGGEIKLVIDEWNKIDKIDTEATPTKSKDHDNNKPAREAIDAIKRYTENTSDAPYTTIGQHDTAANAVPSKWRNWNKS